MESKNNEISLFTDGAIETITANHNSEIESIKHKYENQIIRIKGLHDGLIKKLKEQHEKQVEDINIRHLVTLQNTKNEFENTFQKEINLFKNEINVLKNENKNLKESLSIKDLNIKNLENQVKKLKLHPYELKYKKVLNELKQTQAFQETLRKELGRAITKGKEAWDIFRQNCPEEYLRYTNQYNKMSSVSTQHYVPETQHYVPEIQQLDTSHNVWSGKLLLDTHQNTNQDIQFGNLNK